MRVGAVEDPLNDLVRKGGEMIDLAGANQGQQEAGERCEVAQIYLGTI